MGLLNQHAEMRPRSTNKNLLQRLDSPEGSGSNLTLTDLTMNSDNPLVSVIIPNYNHECFLAERIQSVISQTFQDFELIVLDDASTDHSVELIKELLRDRPYRLDINAHNSGSPTSQWLKGIRMARGKFVWIAESDDVAEASFLETMVNRLTPGVSLAYCRTIQIDHEGRQTSKSFWPDFIAPGRWHADFTSRAADELLDYMTKLNTIPNASCCVFRRSNVKCSSGYDQFRYVGDWLFWSDLMAHSPQSQITYTSSPLAMHRTHEHTTRHLSACSRLELKRFREYSAAINRIMRLSNLSWWNCMRLSLTSAWDWSYIAFKMQKNVFKGLHRFFPPFIGWHGFGYLMHGVRQLEGPYNTRKALLKQQLKLYALAIVGK
jgi:glycosyltransferase involved in cell wall biosynthesis